MNDDVLAAERNHLRGLVGMPPEQASARIAERRALRALASAVKAQAAARAGMTFDMAEVEARAAVALALLARSGRTEVRMP